MSDGIGELVKALCAAKKAFEGLKKGQTADTGKYTYSYADRHDVIASYAGALADNGLQIIHTVRTDDNMHMRQVSILAHTSGQMIESTIPIPNVPNAQTLGSWLTYLERYHSCALLDIAAEADDDGAGASGSAATEAPRKNVPAAAQGERLPDGSGVCPTCSSSCTPWKNADASASHFCGKCRKPFLATAAKAEEVPA